jgi:16S rRNA (cytidine1402-2'-O)-methyltransferase
MSDPPVLAAALAADADPSLAAVLRHAARRAAGSQQYPEAALYVIATPIGNLADLSLRAIEVFGRLDALACEDTRHTRTLLQHLGLAPPLLALHAHNEQAAADDVLARLGSGQRVGLVSDAGTPAISDPGARLVARVQAAGHRVVPVAGPSAVAAAISVAGLAAPHWTFVGFLPARGRERQQALAAWLRQPQGLVLYESPQRIEALLRALAELAPQRQVTVGRELTKQFEQIISAPASAITSHASLQARGEFVVVVHAPPASAKPGEAGPLGNTHACAGPAGVAGVASGALASDDVLALLQRSLPLRQAVDLAVQITGRPRKQLYATALQRQQQGEPANDPEAD